MCSYDPKARKNTLDLFDIEAANLVRNPHSASNDAVSQFQQVLLNETDAHSFKMRYCKEKFLFDIAMVEVIMESPTVIKYIQRYKATSTDKLANFGMKIYITKDVYTFLAIISSYSMISQFYFAYRWKPWPLHWNEHIEYVRNRFLDGEDNYKGM